MSKSLFNLEQVTAKWSKAIVQVLTITTDPKIMSLNPYPVPDNHKKYIFYNFYFCFCFCHLGIAFLRSSAQ